MERYYTNGMKIIGVLVIMLVTVLSSYSQVDASVCQLVATPDQFSGKIVQVRGALHPTMHATSIDDEECGKSISIEYPGKSDELTLTRDERFEDFEQWLRKLLYRRDVANANRVVVTLVARYETISGTSKKRGFGDHSLAQRRLVLQEVRDIMVEPLISGDRR